MKRKANKKEVKVYCFGSRHALYIERILHGGAKI